MAWFFGQTMPSLRDWHALFMQSYNHSTPSELFLRNIGSSGWGSFKDLIVKLPKGEKMPIKGCQAKGQCEAGFFIQKNPGRITNSLQTKWGKIISISQKYPTN